MDVSSTASSSSAGQLQEIAALKLARDVQKQEAKTVEKLLESVPVPGQTGQNIDIQV